MTNENWSIIANSTIPTKEIGANLYTDIFSKFEIYDLQVYDRYLSDSDIMKIVNNIAIENGVGKSHLIIVSIFLIILER